MTIIMIFKSQIGLLCYNNNTRTMKKNKKINVLVADNNFLVRLGLRSVIEEERKFHWLGEVTKAEELNEKLSENKTDVLIIDYASSKFCVDDISIINEYFPKVKILAITYPQTKQNYLSALQSGVISHLLKECSKDEIVEAIYSTCRGEKFFCGKVVDVVFKENETSNVKGVSCDGVKISGREIEIIKLVAEGLSNKEIADKLFLSIHTIATHRKNIMSKLDVNNSAGLVMYAIEKKLIPSNNSFAYKSEDGIVIAS